MSTVQQTLRRARQVDEKFKAFMAGKQERDRSMQQTMRKIKQTQQTLASTKLTINKIDSLYDSIEERFSQAIDTALKGVENSSMLNMADPDWKPNQIGQKQFVGLLKESKQVMFLTGAGISVASGISTFRGANGYWDRTRAQNPGTQMLENVQRPEEILTLKHFKENPFHTWQWLMDFYETKTKATLNKGHIGLDTIMRQLLYANKKTMLVTQNIDNFHVQAQQQKLFKQKLSEQKLSKQTKQKNPATYTICQIHGNITKLRCQACSSQQNTLQFHPFPTYLPTIKKTHPPLCPQCTTPLRPHIMFFDQYYTQLHNQSITVKQFEKETDLLVVIGTSLQTGLSKDIVQSLIQRKVKIVEINVQCEIRKNGVLWMEGKADQILDRVKVQVWKVGL